MTEKVKRDRKWFSIPVKDCLHWLGRSLIGATFCTIAGQTGPLNAQPAGEVFVEMARAAGIDFIHFNGMSGSMYMPEILGSGGALFDYDNDGDLDLYLVQGCMIGPGKTYKDARVAPQGQPPLSDRLYRNDLKIGPDGKRELRFTDVTQQCGIRATGYGMGVAVADYDNDGWLDLYIANLDGNQMWHNQGDGTFRDATVSTGTMETRWTVSAAFFDYDRDGLLDLYVANYSGFSFEKHKTCINKRGDGLPEYCGPSEFPDQTDRLFRNLGGGRFEDVTTKAGIDKEAAAGLGVVASDFNGDGWLDIYVANDADPNLLWINQKNGTFINEALLSGCAFNSSGFAEAGMGLDAADFDGDGDDDLFMTHLTGETNTLYVNDGSGFFEDLTLSLGLGTPSLDLTGFGTAWFDYDNDGWLDLLVANGAIGTIEALVKAGDPFPYHQVNQLFHNEGGAKYREVTASAGKALSLSEVSRGAIVGDIDNDGDSDVVITNNNGPARLLINRVGSKNHWLGIRLMDGKRDALGARVGVVLENGKTIWRRVRTDGSYGCSSDPRPLFGLGSAAKIVKILVRAADGREQVWPAAKIDGLDGYHTLHLNAERVK